jgi:hypothetical protein
MPATRTSVEKLYRTGEVTQNNRAAEKKRQLLMLIAIFFDLDQCALISPVSCCLIKKYCPSMVGQNISLFKECSNVNDVSSH